MKLEKYGFTLVELIVVITIVAILSAIWFVSYTNYIIWARDTNRISQLWKLSDSLQLYVGTNNKKLPIPDDSITLLASWSTMWYQWYAGVNVLNTIDYQNGGQDPKDDSYFTYLISADKRSFQVMWFLEENDYLTWEFTLDRWLNTYAVDLSTRYPKSQWSKLWIILEDTTYNPVQELESIQGAGELDLDSTTGTSYEIVFSDNEIFPAVGLLAYSMVDESKIQLDPSLVLYYNLEDFVEVDGVQKVKDLSGKWNHGTPLGNIEFIDGHAEDNNPTTRTARIETPYVVNLSTNDYTFVAMSYEKSVRPVVNFWAVFWYGPGTAELLLFYWYTLYTNYYYLWNGWDVGSTGIRKTDSWQHFVATTESNGNTQLFQDGVANTAVDIGDFANSTINLQAMCYGAANYCLDRIDEVRVYNRKLSAEEVQILYETTAKNY